MAESGKSKPALNAPSTQLRLDDRPDELRFQFQGRQSGVGAGLSTAAHIVLGLIFLLIIRLGQQVLPPELLDPNDTTQLVFLPIPGPGGGGGGGGDPKPEPPRKYTLSLHDALPI